MTPSLSIFRGQARRGIGEGPGLGNAPGEQYLAVDAPLWDVEVMRELRPILTLDMLDQTHRELEYRMEGWVCFNYRSYVVVARLVSNPHFLRHDDRAAYFTHARLWDYETCAWDEGAETLAHPGALVGHGWAFDDPWPEETRPEPHLEPSFTSVVNDAVLEDEARAARLLAWSYEAHAQGRALVVGAPLSSFVQGSPLGRLLGWARAALPSHLRARCRLLTCTHHPAFAIQSLRATLLAVPESRLVEVVRGVPSAILLDASAQAIDGREPGPFALEYGRRTAIRATRLPGGLLPFTLAISPLLADPGVSEPALASALSTVYNVAFAQVRPDARGQMLERIYGAVEAVEAPVLRHLLRIEAPSIWSGVPRSEIVRLATSSSLPAPEPGWLTDASTAPPGHALRTLAEAVLLLKPDDTLDEALSARLAEPPLPDELAVVGWLRARGLVTGALAASASGRHRALALIQSPWGLSLLANELDAALTGMPLRELGPDEVLALVDRWGYPMFELMARATRAGWLSVSWLLAVDRHLDGAHHAEAGAEILSITAAMPLIDGNGQRTLPLQVLNKWLARLRAMTPVPARAAEVACELVVGLHLDLPTVCAQLAELAILGGSAASVAARTCARAQFVTPTAKIEDRRWFMAAALGEDAVFPGLDDLVSTAGALRVPEAWLEEFATTLASHERLLARLALPGLLKLESVLPADGPGRQVVARHIDQRVAESDGLTDLVIYGGWARWLRRRPAEKQLDSAMALLASPAWRQPDAPRIRPEDWRRLMLPLRPARLGRDEVMRLLGDAPAPWRSSTGEVWTYLADLIALTRDQEALITLAELLHRQGPEPRPSPDVWTWVVSRSPHEIKDPTLLALLTTEPTIVARTDLGQLNLARLRPLVRAPGERRSQLRDRVWLELCRLVAGRDGPEALALLKELELWPAPAVLERIVAAVASAPSVESMDARTLGEIDQTLGASMELLSTAELPRTHVAQLQRLGLLEIATTIDPEAAGARWARLSGEHGELARELLARRSDSAAWERFVRHAPGQAAAARVLPYPMTGFLRWLMQCKARMARSEWRRMVEAVDACWTDLCLRMPDALGIDPQTGRAPAIDLAREVVGFGLVSRLLSAVSLRPEVRHLGRDPRWWQAAARSLSAASVADQLVEDASHSVRFLRVDLLCRLLDVDVRRALVASFGIPGDPWPPPLMPDNNPRGQAHG